MTQWAADIAVDRALAAQLVASRFPYLSAAAVEPFGFGWDNTAFLVDGHLIFRFPRRRAAARLIEREASILPGIAPRLPLAISAPTLIGAPTSIYPWLFAGYELIRGAAVSSLNLSDSLLSNLAESLASFLKALHHIETAPLIAKGLPNDEIGRLDHEKRSKMTHQRLPLLIDLGFMANEDRLTTWLQNHPPIPPNPQTLCLVHGDLYARHVLVGDAGKPVGIIDWGDVHLGDPAIDIALAHLILPPSAHEAFQRSYGSIDDRTWNAARYRAIYHAILELDYGIREDDAGMRESGSTALRYIRTALKGGVS